METVWGTPAVPAKWTGMEFGVMLVRVPQRTADEPYVTKSELTVGQMPLGLRREEQT